MEAYRKKIKEKEIMIKGCDVSVYQGNIDYDQLRNAVDFVIIRSSYGNGYEDKYYKLNRQACHDRSICKGYYHYCYPQYNSAEAEAAWFLKTIGTPDEGDVLALDFEEHFADPVSWCKSWLDYVSQNTNGTKPVIYLNQSLMKAYDWSPVSSAGYGLWLAEYDNNPDGPIPANTWPVLAFRQYGSSAQLPGIPGNCDGDVFYGDKIAFQKYGYHPAPIVVTPTEPPAVVTVPQDPTTAPTATSTIVTTITPSVPFYDPSTPPTITPESASQSPAIATEPQKISFWRKLLNFLYKLLAVGDF